MTQPEDKFRVASPEEARKFFEHVLEVLDSAEPADTHVVIHKPVLLAIEDHLDACVSGPFSDAATGMLPESVLRYAEEFNANTLKFSELCLVGTLAEQIHVSSFDGGPERLCVPKYMIDALFQILIDPPFAKRMREWFSVQDYNVK